MRLDPLPYERIRTLRIDHDFSQKEVANFLHVAQNTYAQYEVGSLHYPLDIVIKLALYYETSVDYLVGLTDNPAPYARAKTMKQRM